MSKLNAGVLIIGDEILSGRTQDTNSHFIAKNLIESGINLEEIKIIQDDKNLIKESVLDFYKKYNYVFTTGGIGPTHDDITSKSIAKAFEVSYGYHKEAYEILKKYYKSGEFNEGRKKMAKIPETATLIYNPSSGAPGFIVENVFCLPGVPSILKSMLGGLKNEISGGNPIISHTINLRTVESEIAKPLKEVQENNIDVEIGSYPFFKSDKVGVAIVLRSEDESKISICKKQSCMNHYSALATALPQ